MPAIVPFIPLIAGGIGAAGSIIGAHEAASSNTQAAQTSADAATKAAQIQADSANKSLDFLKDVYGTKQEQVSPYIGYGQGALSALGAGLGVTPVKQPPPAGTMAPMPPGTKTAGLPQSLSGLHITPQGINQPPTTTVTGPFAGLQNGVLQDLAQKLQQQQQAQQQTGSSVQLKAPNGQIGTVPADQVDHYLALGAQRV